MLLLWSELSPAQKIAARVLEYNEFFWNEGVYRLVEPGAYDDFFFAELPVEIQEGAGFLGYDQQTWDSGEEASTSLLLWDQLSEQEKIGATRLGYDQESWDSS